MTNAGEGMSALSVMVFLRRQWEESSSITIECHDAILGTVNVK
jgi:hypothetical protein